MYLTTHTFSYFGDITDKMLGQDDSHSHKKKSILEINILSMDIAYKMAAIIITIGTCHYTFSQYNKYSNNINPRNPDFLAVYHRKGVVPTLGLRHNINTMIRLCFIITKLTTLALATLNNVASG